MNRIPLAEKLRPEKLSDVIGQSHLIGPDKILNKIVEKNEPVNLIFWGPPGIGKTTLARIIATGWKSDFIEISAVTSGKKDVEKVVEHARLNWNLQIRTVLFVDEIHRFNKAQQDAFLPHVESGLITLIGATTENPSFEIITPLLSRSRVLVLNPLAKTEILQVLRRAVKLENATKKIDKKSLDYIAELSGGDARTALGNLELSLSLSEKVTVETVKTAAQKIVPGYDKKGDMHYDVISAFIKSMRGSDIDAALYYLARMIQAGEDPKFIARRMVIFASEDIGLAGNHALTLALSAFQSIERVGMPEGGIILSHVTVALCKSPKSRQTYDAWHRALDLANKSPNHPVPLVLRNAPTKLMKDLNYGKTKSGESQKWTAGHHADASYLPDDLPPDPIFQ
ncbi:replication-associated recombination protein A [Candidatus Saccharibacteria bacterium]|nr:replication-associated recombination protein A [Candidatus Saccharibacteria bacterium]